MSAARTAFLARHRLLRACLLEQATQDGTPAEVQRNRVAAVFRNGLAVLIYATAEDFVRERTAEILRSLNPATVTFAALSDKLKRAVTIGALRGLLARHVFQPEADRVNWVVANLPPIASATVNLSHLSKYSFAHDGANVSEEDVAKILSSFGVDHPWICVTALSKRVGMGGIPDYKTAFESVAKKRHAAAHDVTTMTPFGDLETSLDTILGFGITFDLLISEAQGQLNSLLGPRPGSFESHISLRFLTPHETAVDHVREKLERAKNPQTLRTTRIHPTIVAARVAAAPRMRRNRQHLVELDNSGRPLTWLTW
jgi:hypothetical protein